MLNYEKRDTEALSRELSKIIDISNQKKREIEEFRNAIELLRKLEQKIVLKKCEINESVNLSMKNIIEQSDLNVLKQNLRSQNIIDEKNQKTGQLNGAQLEYIWNIHS